MICEIHFSRPTLTQTMQSHIDQLAAEHGIKVDQAPKLPGMMYVEEKPPRIETPSLDHWFAGAPSTTICYMVALHEIGHCVLGHTQGRPPHTDDKYYFDHGVLRCEAEAWNFALDQCRVVLLPWERSFIANKYIGSYIRKARELDGKPSRLGNGNRHHVLFTFDNPDDPYIKGTVSRILADAECLQRYF